MADRDFDDRTSTTTGAAGSGLRRLSELGDYEVADGHPDIRGWKVRTPDGQVLGKVDDLIVSVSEMRVRYLDVDVDRSVRSAVVDAASPKGAEPGHALVPIGTARLDDAGDDVIVNSLTGADLASYPLYERKGGISREYEHALRGHLGAGTTGTETADEFYAHEQYDDAQLFGARGGRKGANADARDLLVRRPSGSEAQKVQRGSTGGGFGGGFGAGAADRATNSGLADRLADKADNLKDRVDGNPASRPGPDATDSRI